MIRLRAFVASDRGVYESWFVDEETARRVSPPDQPWLDYVLLGERSACWVAEEQDGEPVAFIQADWDDDGRAYVAVVVDPKRRRRGVATEALSSFLSGPAAGFRHIEARVEDDNRASMALARRCGFRQVGTGPDADGMIRLVLDNERTEQR